MLLRVLLGAFFVAHGLVHLLYFVPSGDPKYPMTAEKSWLVTRIGLPLGVVSPVVSALAAASAVGFCLLALSYWGLVVPTAWLPALAVISVTTSLLLVAVTWNIQFIFSVFINIAILYWALVWRTR